MRVEGQLVGAIERGFLALVGIERGDSEDQVAKAVHKISGLRVFADANGQMNLALGAVDGSVLVVSQFTLAARLDRGRRPSFEPAAPPAEAEPLVASLADGLRGAGLRVEMGQFGAEMAVELINDGPVTFVLEL